MELTEWLFSKVPKLELLNMQISDDYVLHIQGIQCMVHHTYLVVQVLSKLNMVNKLESLFQTLYAYFYKSPKRHLELIKLTKIMEIKRNRPPNNGTSRSTVKKNQPPPPPSLATQQWKNSLRKKVTPFPSSFHTSNERGKKKNINLYPPSLSRGKEINLAT